MTFEETYARFEAIDKTDYKAVLEQYANETLPVLMDITGSESTGARLLAQFVLAAAVADGELAENEYALLEPMFKSFFGDEVSFAESKALVKTMAKGEKGLTELADDLIDLLGILSDEFKAQLVMICLMICAVDGNVSESEKQWIKRLAA